MNPASRKKNIGYAEAIVELETILEEMEEESIDVDELSAKVKRASELIALCKEKLSKTQVEIDQVIAGLEEEEDGEEDDDEF